MSLSFPSSLSFGTPFQYPVTKTLTLPSKVQRFGDDTETRFLDNGGGWIDFTFAYAKVKFSDITTLRDFFNSTQGSFDHTWSMSFNGGSYTNCRFLDYRFSARQDGPVTWSTTLRARSYHPFAPSPTADLTFPVLSTGAISQLPYTEHSDWRNVVVDLADGEASAGSYRSAALRAFQVSCPLLSETEYNAIEAHWINCGGQVAQFSVKDEDGTTHTKCRYDSDSLTVRYVSPGVVSFDALIVEHG